MLHAVLVCVPCCGLSHLLNLPQACQSSPPPKPHSRLKGDGKCPHQVIDDPKERDQQRDEPDEQSCKHADNSNSNTRS